MKFLTNKVHLTSLVRFTVSLKIYVIRKNSQNNDFSSHGLWVIAKAIKRYTFSFQVQFFTSFENNTKSQGFSRTPLHNFSLYA